jgi:hypothetical protein
MKCPNNICKECRLELTKCPFNCHNLGEIPTIANYESLVIYEDYGYIYNEPY